ncbi:MAG: xanthine dehydrogenase family protein subunit M [Gammaproteobacteria bacterium]|nr:xanthine dehydrogenase family protein subunit M [Gammaproteobacteria bacterium]
MKPFAYVRASSIQEATRNAAAGGTRYIAGGTNLLDLMKLEIETPDVLIDISRLGLDQVETTVDGGLRIGALVSNADLAADPRTRRDYPMLVRALLAGASAQLRNKATTAGNLLQRTRCGYFYEPSSRCNKRLPDSGCDALEGLNRSHAILGGSAQCIAVHPSDMAVALIALDAAVEVLNAHGQTRTLALGDLYRLPGDTPARETNLEPGELIAAVYLPAPAAGRQEFRKIRDRASFAFALVSMGVTLGIENDVIEHVRMAFGGIAPMPWRDPAVEALIEGQRPSMELFQHAATVLLQAAEGHGDNAFKIELTRRLMVYVLLRATTASGEERAA